MLLLSVKELERVRSLGGWILDARGYAKLC